MKHLIFITLSSLFVLSCNSLQQNNDVSIETEDIEETEPTYKRITEEELCEKDSLLIASMTKGDGEDLVKLNNFSSSKHLDTFKLSYYPENLTIRVEFTITTFEGVEIHNEKFDISALGGYGTPSYVFVSNPNNNGFNGLNVSDSIKVRDSLEQKDKEYFISRLESFFDNQHFVTNPYPELLEKEVGNIDKALYQKLKNDSTLASFSYSLVACGRGIIVYSKAEKKVITIYTCC